MTTLPQTTSIRLPRPVAAGHTAGRGGGEGEARLSWDGQSPMRRAGRRQANAGRLRQCGHDAGLLPEEIPESR